MNGGISISFDKDPIKPRELTPAQKTVLEAVHANPGKLRPEANPNTLAACFMKGWIKSGEVRPDPLKKAPWSITPKGLAILDRHNS